MSFPECTEDEVLVEPLFGCWEGNMTHALQRRPVDICRLRHEDRVVIGNAGVVRVLSHGARVTQLREGDLCLAFCNGVWDEHGYARKIYGYDAAGSIGLLAARTKLHQRQLIPIPSGTRHTLPQWAAFSLRYVTAWANWKVAYGCWRVHVAGNGHGNGHAPMVWGWGGGVTFAELTLARASGAQAWMFASDSSRIEQIAEAGLVPLDRRQFGCLTFDPDRYASDLTFRAAYRDAEDRFLALVQQQTQGRGVSIFVDFIGLPVFRATLKSLGCPGIVTTAGWRDGMELSTIRAIECMAWHVHVHTHYARYEEALEAVRFGEEHGWMPPVEPLCGGWDDIPRIASDHSTGRLSTYFPLFEINAV
jgi:NADPH:quinone reductase-like Zn-dependent oxidoreductase